ncbi:MAG: ergothioneine biosynthesis protein EgtB [Acidobacteriaceae bacterium]|jgi:ergothioneine biosynthesis protein EgtB
MSTPALRPTPTPASSALLDHYRTVRAATLALTTPLSPEDLMVQSCAEASPAKWHLAHTTWFFETFVLREFLPAYRDFHPDFHWLFNSYYNSLGDMPAKSLRSSFSRPPLAEILSYRDHVDTAIARFLESTPSPEAARRIVLGLHHEQQHQELIATDIKHALFTNPLHPAYLSTTTTAAPSLSDPDAIAPPLDWLTFTPGLTQIGFAPNSPDDFSFDNETPRHSVYLAPFSLATRLVTCAEYLAFMDDNGYTRPELWLSDGWTALREQAWQAPLYWQRSPATASGWRIFTLRGWQPLEDLSETPVCHLSFFEAEAYARWSARRDPGARLPTEFEWEFAASQIPTETQEPVISTEAGVPGELCSLGWKARSAQRRDPRISPFAPSNLLESNTLHPTRASSLPGLQQLYGDVWEWTASAYLGYPGYHPLPGALGEYNGKFMSSQMVLRGGSCVTPTTHIRATYRNFFPPSTRWQFSGLRLAKDLPAT